jgi:ABC-type polysaccharide/polyol phosphate export permease
VTTVSPIEPAPLAQAPARGAMRYAPLFRNLVKREVRQRYKGSALGLAWTLVTPAIMIGAYSLVFKFLLRIQIPYYALFLLVGLTVWTFFLGGLQIAARSLIANANLVTKVRFPREIVPLAAMTGNAFTAGAMLVVTLPLCAALSVESLWPLVTLPALVVLLAMFTAGLGLAMSAVNVYFRDVEHILNAIALPWIFLSPVFYTFDTVPGLSGEHAWVEALLHWGNPIAPYIITIQDALFFGTWPAVADVVYCLGVGTATLAAGWWLFHHLEPEMAVEL